MKMTELDQSVRQDITEGWSQKYKSSINCSHPKGFSQKAHCAGKKKHTESVETEMTCPDCGMCKTHGSLNEIAKGAKDSNGFTRCWPGKHAEGTKKGKNGGQVRNCVPNESQGVAEAKVIGHVSDVAGHGKVVQCAKCDTDLRDDHGFALDNGTYICRSGKCSMRQAKNRLAAMAAQGEKPRWRKDEDVAEALGTSPDRLLARTGMNNAHKFPRKDQTDLRDIPGMNYPDAGPETKAYAERQRAARSSDLKAAIKGQHGQHHKPNLPEQGVAEAFENDESNMMYRFNPETGRLGQRMIHNNEEQVAHRQGYRDSHESALKAQGIVRSKFKPGKWVQKQGNSWTEVFPYGKPDGVDESATAGATSAANVGVGAVYNNKPPKQPKNKDGTAKNAVDMKGVNLLTGGSLKR